MIKYRIFYPNEISVTALTFIQVPSQTVEARVTFAAIAVFPNTFQFLYIISQTVMLFQMNKNGFDIVELLRTFITHKHRTSNKIIQFSKQDCRYFILILRWVANTIRMYVHI